MANYTTFSSGAFTDAQKTNETTRSAKIYTDLNLYFQRNSSNQDINKVTDVQSVKRAIKNTSFDVIRPPDYDNKATRSAATDYQAGENGYLVIFWTGNYRNGGRIFVGPNTSSYTTVYENGDDINNKQYIIQYIII